jgi:hypothetical protein
VQPPALAPFTAYEVTDTRRAARQQQRQREHIQQQQQQQDVLEQLLQDSTDAAGIANHKQQQPQQQQQQRLAKSELAAWERLVAAGKWRLRLDPGEVQLLLHQLQPALSAFKPGQLAHAAHAVSVLPNGAAAAASMPAWQPSLLAAAAELFAAGRMDDWASSVLLQALAWLQAQPGPAWLHAACAGMDVSGWDSSRALATVAACLPQLGHVPDSSWAASYFAATATKLYAMPAVSLARMLHGVVAWHHLQLQQQQQQERQEEVLVLPEQWVCRVLHELHACSSELRPCEVAMVLQTLGRLQAPGFIPCSSDSNRSSSTVAVGQQPQSQLQVCVQQLLHALVLAVARQRHDFGAQDLAVVLHSMALLQQQAEQPEQQLCSWEWLERVLPAVEVGWLCCCVKRGLAVRLTYCVLSCLSSCVDKEGMCDSCVLLVGKGMTHLITPLHALLSHAVAAGTPAGCQCTDTDHHPVGSGGTDAGTPAAATGAGAATAAAAAVDTSREFIATASAAAGDGCSSHAFRCRHCSCAAGAAVREGATPCGEAGVARQQPAAAATSRGSCVHLPGSRCNLSSSSGVGIGRLSAHWRQQLAVGA